MMRPVILSLLGLLITGLLHGQYSELQAPTASVQNQPMLKSVERMADNVAIISEPKSSLDKATGWTLLDNGKWVSSENRLLFKNSEYAHSERKYYKLGRENFDLITIRDVTYENELYAVMIIQFKTGYYEFPILMRDWHYQNGLTYFVFKHSKLDEVIPEKMEFNKVYITNMEVICSGTMVDYDNKNFTREITVDIERAAYEIKKNLTDKTIAGNNLLIAFWPVQTGGQTLARFRLIQVMNKKKFYTPYLELKNRDKIFRSTYYEIEYNTFQSFIHDSGGPVSIQQYSGIPQTADDYYRRGVSNYGSGNYAQAVLDLTEASKYPPYTDFFLTYAYRGNARHKMGDASGAMQDFDRAVMLKPSDQSYYTSWLTTIYNRGVARYYLKDLNGACQDWNTALQFGYKDIENDKALKEYCRNYNYRGPSMNFTTVSSVPTSTYSSAPGIQNDYYKVYWDGVWKYENGNYTEAIRSFNRALELKPQSTGLMGIYSYRGNCKLKLADYNGAILDFDYALGLSTTQVTDNNTLKSIYYNRGLANFFLGNTSISCSDFQKSLNSGMNDPQSVGFIRQVCK